MLFSSRRRISVVAVVFLPSALFADNPSAPLTVSSSTAQAWSTGTFEVINDTPGVAIAPSDNSHALGAIAYNQGPTASLIGAASASADWTDAEALSIKGLGVLDVASKGGLVKVSYTGVSSGMARFSASIGGGSMNSAGSGVGNLGHSQFGASAGDMNLLTADGSGSATVFFSVFVTSASRSSNTWDLDGDGLFTTIDISLVQDAVGGTSLTYDLDKDDDVDGDDVTFLLDDYGTVPGDVDLDHDVDISDFAALSANFNKVAVWGQAGIGTSAGDFNRSGFADAADFAALSANFGWTPSSPRVAIPEPSIGLAVSSVWLAGRRRR